MTLTFNTHKTSLAQHVFCIYQLKLLFENWSCSRNGTRRQILYIEPDECHEKKFLYQLTLGIGKPVLKLDNGDQKCTKCQEKGILGMEAKQQTKSRE